MVSENGFTTVTSNVSVDTLQIYLTELAVILTNLNINGSDLDGFPVMFPSTIALMV